MQNDDDGPADEGGHRRVTSFDVARLAGVSRAAVSRAFARDGSISPKMRAKVQEAADELGYRVNYLARSLNSNRSDLVGVVAAGMDNPFRPMQIHAIAQALLTRNFRPILLPTASRADVSDVINQVLHYSVSGVVVTSDAPPTRLCEECAARGVPIVLINKGDEIPFVDRVMSDDDAAAHIAAQRLAEQGVRQPAVLAAVDVSYSARRRADAFLRRCKDLGLDARLLPIAVNDYANGLASVGCVASSGSDGLFCVNDYLACGVLDGITADPALADLRRIPMIGHDNIPQAAWGAYKLTTIEQNCDVQASRAIDLLTDRIRQSGTPARVEVTPVKLIVRSSG